MANPWDQPYIPTEYVPDVGPPVAPSTPPPAPAPVQASPTTLPTSAPQNLAFRIPVLGTVLDTARDLIVGPGNEGLTTQEQITRGILNTIVLAKAPQALPGMYEANSYRDSRGRDLLGSPAFKARVLELMDPNGTSKLDEPTAIKRASYEYNVPGGIELPTSLMELPPTSLEADIKYAQAAGAAGELRDLHDPNNQTRISPSVPPTVTAEAQRRRVLGLPPRPGDAELLSAQAKVIERNIPDPDVFGGDETTGFIDQVTGQPISVQGTPPGAGGPPVAGEESMTAENVSETLKSLRPAEDGIPNFVPKPIYDPVTHTVRPGRRLITDAEREKLRAEKAARDNAIIEYNTKRDAKLRFESIGRARASADESREVARRAGAAIDELKMIAGVKKDANGKEDFTNSTVWGEYEPPSFKGKSFAGRRTQELKAQTYAWEQTWRSWNEGVLENNDLGIYESVEGPVATLLARIFGDTRLSDEDRRVFKEALPRFDDYGKVAESKFGKLPMVTAEIYKRAKEYQDKVEIINSEWNTKWYGARALTPRAEEPKESQPQAAPNPQITPGPQGAATDDQWNAFRQQFKAARGSE